MLADRLVAHRGYQKLYPENTLLSLKKAIEAGAHYIEMDVQFSSDHCPMIYHDSLLTRVSGNPGIIHALSEEQLSETPAYEPERLGEEWKQERIAPLRDLVPLLKAHPEVTAFVELKEASIDIFGRDRVLDSVGETLHPVIKKCVLISFDYQVIADARLEGWPQVGVVLHQWDDLTHPIVLQAEPNYIFADHNIIPETLDVELPETSLVAYEVSTGVLGKALLSRGVDMLETFDFPGLLRSLGHDAI